MWHKNFLVDNTGHVKLTDFGLATGALNPQKIESMKQKVCWPSQRAFGAKSRPVGPSQR